MLTESIGTSPDTTMADYLRRLRYSDRDSSTVITQLLSDLLCSTTTCDDEFSLYEASPPTHQPPLLSVPANSRVPVVVNNPLAWHNQRFIQLFMDTLYAEITFSNGTTVPVQVQEADNSYIYSFLCDLQPSSLIYYTKRQHSATELCRNAN